MTNARGFRILLSAFACAPNAGSELGSGWHYALRLAELHDVWVLTDESRRTAIEQVGDILPPGLHIHYYRPYLLRAIPLNSRTAHFIYQLWQFGAWKVAKVLDEEHDFDFCWHLTYGVFRQPSWMWKVGKPFVFGPVGGGERAPMRLRRSMPLKARISELARDVLNMLSWYLPGLRATYRHADLVIARTIDTKNIFPKWIQERTVVQQEIGGYPARSGRDDRAGHNGELKLLFAGRLLALKGIHIALPAFEQFLHQGGRGTLTIVGDGPMSALLKAQALRLGISDRVRFISRLPQDELFRRYPQFDALLFPSLRDSGGNVVIESLSFGLPVICLDLGGPSCFVNETCGIVIAARDMTEDELIEAIASSLLTIHSNPVLHQQLCRGALERAEELTWERQIDRTVELVEGRLRLHADILATQ